MAKPVTKFAANNGRVFDTMAAAVAQDIAVLLVKDPNQNLDAHAFGLLAVEHRDKLISMLIQMDAAENSAA
jgi:hypothetical protein